MISRIVHSLRARLLAMLILSLAPAMALALFMGNQELAREKEQAFEEARRQALLTASNCKTLLEGGQRLLAGVAASPCAAEFNLEQCDGLMTRLLARYSEYTNFALLDPKGEVISSTLGQSQGLALPQAARKWVAQLLASEAPSLWGSGECPLTGRPAIVMLYKVIKPDGGLCSVVLMSLDLAWFDELAAGFRPGPETTVSLVSRQGLFLARYPESGSFIGKPIPDAERVMPGLLEKIDDAWEITGVDNISRIYAFAPVIDIPGAEVYARIGVPASAAYAEAYRSFSRNLFLLGAMGLLILCGAAIFAQVFVLGQAKRIREGARRLTAGELGFRVGMDKEKGELAELGQAFDLMAGAIEDHTLRLRLAEENYRSLVENVSVGIFRCQVGAKAKFISVNHTLGEIFGYLEPEKFAAASPREIFSQVRTQEGTNFWEAMSRGQPINGLQGRFSERHGQTLWLSLSLTPHTLGRSGPPLLDGVIEDVSAVKEVERHLKLAYQESQRASRLKGEFLSLVSHEMRTPLTSISGFAKIIAKKLEKIVFPALPSEEKGLQRAKSQLLKDLEIIVEEGRRLSSFVDDVLDLAGLEAENAQFCLEPTDLSGLLEKCARDAARTCQEKGLILDLQIEPGLTLYCDPGRIRQVVGHLLSNAVKFTPQGRVELHALTQDQEILISVRDTGLGIPRQDWENIFLNFKQLGDQLTAKPKGMGLGLSICKLIVERHGGRIWLTSELGQGSVFFCSLPLRGPAKT